MGVCLLFRARVMRAYSRMCCSMVGAVCDWNCWVSAISYDSVAWIDDWRLNLHSAGFGGQLGAEITDFVFILNDSNAVKTFAQSGR